MKLLEELRSLDPRDPGRWPFGFRAGVVGVSFVVLSLVATYFFVWTDLNPQLQQLQDQEQQLRNEFRTKHSKATNLDAVDKALRAQSKPVILIAGGKDKGFSFDALRSLVKEKVKSTILIGEMAESIRRSWNGAVQSQIANSLADAVERAHASARPGDVVLFSPGTSSFDMFKSYADRGDQFRALVQALPKRER